ncbi:AP2 domain-containing protein [Clostridium botulinum]|nr:AP2 domain-containing protein [Clostridium botulinum]
MPIKNIIGNRYGRLVVIKSKREDKRTWHYCKCDCGTEKWIRADSLSNGSVISCGCYNRETNYKKPVNIENKRFERLIAIKPTKEKDKYNGSILWECKCDCGNTCYVAEYRLSKGEIKSCGCLGTETYKNNIQKAIKEHFKKHIVEGTNITIISRKTPRSNNTSGTTGVMWNSNRNKWSAVITFKGKVYYLGRYKNKEDAIKIRKEAEEKLFGEFLKWYNEEIKGEK